MVEVKAVSFLVGDDGLARVGELLAAFLPFVVGFVVLEADVVGSEFARDVLEILVGFKGLGGLREIAVDLGPGLLCVRVPMPSRVSKAVAVWRRRFQRNTNSSR